MAVLPLRTIFASAGRVIVTSLYVTLPIASVIVTSRPETDLILPLSVVTVMKAVPALLRTTASACTAWWPGPCGGRARAGGVLGVVLVLAVALFEPGAAAEPAIPPAAPTAAQTTRAVPARARL